MEFNVAIIRYSEVAVKGPSTRSKMEDLLRSNLEEALSARGVDYDRVDVADGRVLVWARGGEAVRAAEAAARVFGVKSSSPAVRVEFDGIEDLVGEASRFFCSRVRGRVFRVRARRAGRHGFTSKDVERLLGSVLLEKCGAAGVDLTSPEYTARVEVRGASAFFYDLIMEGPGGLPLGSEDRSLVLFSGGFDSTAAAWLVMKRGSPVDLLFYDYGDAEFRRIAVAAAKLLADTWAYGSRPRLVVADFRGAAKLVASKVGPEYRVLVARRLMMLYAVRVAREAGALALVTGENIGQVASQTIANMYLIGGGLELPVIRPLAGFDKEETVNLTRRIGTHDLNAAQVEVCGRASTPTPRGDPEVFRGELEKAAEALDLVRHEYFELKAAPLPEIVKSVERWLEGGGAG